MNWLAMVLGLIILILMFAYPLFKRHKHTFQERADHRAAIERLSQRIAPTRSPTERQFDCSKRIAEHLCDPGLLHGCAAAERSGNSDEDAGSDEPCDEIAEPSAKPNAQ